MKNNKIKIYLLIGVISIIILFLGTVFVLNELSQVKALHNQFMSTIWIKNRDEYQSTKHVEFTGEPIPHTSVYVKQASVEFCNQIEESKPNENGHIFLNDGADCKDYNYSLKGDKLIVFVDKKKVTYNFKFNADNELVLTYSGDGFEFINYYSGAVG